MKKTQEKQTKEAQIMEYMKKQNVKKHVKEISEETGITKNTVWAVTHKLFKEGFLNRLGEGYFQVVVPTAVGKVA